MHPQELTVDSWLKKNAYADAAVYFDTDAQLFIAQVYIDGLGDILEGQGDTSLKAVQDFELKHRVI